MQKTILYFFLGVFISFIINHFLLNSSGWKLELYYAAAFGFAWALAHFLDDEKFSLAQKMGISFLGMALLVIVGTIVFNLELAIPSVIKFSLVFVAYYLMASFRASKSLRK